MSRKALFPPNFQDLSFWTEWTGAIDYVWTDKIDNVQKVFPLLRDTYSFTYAGYNQTEPSGLFDVSSLYKFSPVAQSETISITSTTNIVTTTTVNTGYPQNLVLVYLDTGAGFDFVPMSNYLVTGTNTLKFNYNLSSGNQVKVIERAPSVEVTQQLRYLGFHYPDTDFVTRPTYIDNAHVLQMLAYNFGHYLSQSKGTRSFMDFYGFCFTSVFQIKQLWANSSGDNYGTMLPEDDTNIGTSFVKGGDWYPTSHVNIYYDLFLYGEQVDVDGIRKFFNYVAPLNLVLNDVVLEGTLSAEASMNMAIEGEMIVTWH